MLHCNDTFKIKLMHFKSNLSYLSFRNIIIWWWCLRKKICVNISISAQFLHLIFGEHSGIV